MRNPYLPPKNPANHEVKRRSSLGRILVLSLFVFFGVLLGWGLANFFFFQNPMFNGIGRLFLIFWAMTMIAGGSCGAFFAHTLLTALSEKVDGQ